MTPRIPASLLVAALCGSAFASNLHAQYTDILSVDSFYTLGNNSASEASTSANGSLTAFASGADNLVFGDFNGVSDVFVRDEYSYQTWEVSVSTLGGFGNGLSYQPSISGDGRYVAFSSLASNLAGVDSNGQMDVFLRDNWLGTTERVSKNSLGQEGNGLSWHPSISADGRYVAYESYASNLVTPDTNFVSDIFVWDRITGLVVRASESTGGAQGDSISLNPAISADGRFVAYASWSSNLVAGDTNFTSDVFLRDLQNLTTGRISLSTGGGDPNGLSDYPSLSGDGRHIAFESDASNLVGNDFNGVNDVFVRDRLAGLTERVSVGGTGVEGNGPSYRPSVANGGRRIAFYSSATNFYLPDNNAATDVFLRDRDTGATELISRDSFGTPGNGHSSEPSITAAGLAVMFTSLASNLLPGDVNGVSDVFVRNRGAGTGFELDRLVLGADVFVETGTPVVLSWSGLPSGAPYRLLASFANTGMTINGHPFGIGPGFSVLKQGLGNFYGFGYYVTPPLPASFLGRRIYFEFATYLSGYVYESNTVERLVQ